jgi:alpha-tubulin suppressor-like RCC1 family protein
MNLSSKIFTTSGWFRVPAGVTQLIAEVEADKDVYSFTKIASFSSNQGRVLVSDGRSFGGGFGTSGQLGTGDTINRSTPTQVVNESDFRDIIAGTTLSAGLKSDGRVFTWGAGGSGSLGIGIDANDRSTPVQVINESSFMAIAAPGSSNQMLALKSDGRVFAWGPGASGRLGIGTDINNRSTPAQVINESSFMAISSGTGHGLALKSDGRVFAWGQGTSGILGIGIDVNNRSTPIQVINESGFKAIAAGFVHSLALKSDGRVFSWGTGASGGLGIGTDVGNRSTPVQVVNESDFMAIVAGNACSMALKSDGRIFAWGLNSNSRLGLGDIIDRSTPTQVINESGFMAISFSNNGAAALKSDGRLFTWGFTGTGALSFPAAISANIPIPTKFSDTTKEPGRMISVVPNELIFIKQIGNTFSLRRFSGASYTGIGSMLVLSW